MAERLSPEGTPSPLATGRGALRDESSLFRQSVRPSFQDPEGQREDLLPDPVTHPQRRLQLRPESPPFKRTPFVVPCNSWATPPELPRTPEQTEPASHPDPPGGIPLRGEHPFQEPSQLSPGMPVRTMRRFSVIPDPGPLQNDFRAAFSASPRSARSLHSRRTPGRRPFVFCRQGIDDHPAADRRHGGVAPDNKPIPSQWQPAAPPTQVAQSHRPP